MIENILNMLEIAKRTKQIGDYTHVALGKNYLPTRIRDGYKQLKYETWRKK